MLFNNGNRTFITIEHLEELPILRTRLHADIVDIPEGGPITNKCFFLLIKIDSDKLGEITVPVIYAFAENESFCARIILPSKGIISHIVLVRYGGGCGGGGNASGIWIRNILREVSCELLLSDGHLHSQSGDEATLKIYPALAENATAPKFEIIRTLRNSNWGYNYVDWNLVLQ